MIKAMFTKTEDAFAHIRQYESYGPSPKKEQLYEMGGRPMVGILPSAVLAIYIGALASYKSLEFLKSKTIVLLQNNSDTNALDVSLENHEENLIGVVADYGVIFANSIANICTLGLFNIALMHYRAPPH